MHNVLISISLPFWLRPEKSWNNRFSPGMPLRLSTDPQSAICFQGYYLKILTLWELCLLRYACCWWMLLNVEILRGPLWWRSLWRHRRRKFRLRSGVDQRVLLVDVLGGGLAKQPDIPLQWAEGRALIWSSPIMLSTLKVVTENKQEMKAQEGNEWKAHQTRTWRRGDNVFLRNARHWSLVSWANADVTTLEERETMSKLCTVMCAREKCAFARVQEGVVSSLKMRI